MWSVLYEMCLCVLVQKGDFIHIYVFPIFWIFRIESYPVKSKVDEDFFSSGCVGWLLR